MKRETKRNGTTAYFLGNTNKSRMAAATNIAVPTVIVDESDPPRNRNIWSCNWSFTICPRSFRRSLPGASQKHIHWIRELTWLSPTIHDQPIFFPLQQSHS